MITYNDASFKPSFVLCIEGGNHDRELLSSIGKTANVEITIALKFYHRIEFKICCFFFIKISLIFHHMYAFHCCISKRRVTSKFLFNKWQFV